MKKVLNKKGLELIELRERLDKVKSDNFLKKAVVELIQKTVSKEEAELVISKMDIATLQSELLKMSDYVKDSTDEGNKKASLVFRGTWNGVKIRGYRAIEKLKDYPGLHKYSPGADTVTFIEGKEPVIRTQEEIAVNHIKSKKGVIYKDYIMFLEDDECDELKKFEEEFYKVKSECEKFLDGKISEYVLDYYNFPVLRFILSMFKNNIFSVTTVREKLSNYILSGEIDVVMAEFIKEKEGQ
jgi:hypothetical protein